MLAESHRFGLGLTSAGITTSLVASDTPVDLDWDFAKEVLHVHAPQPSTLTLTLDVTDALCMDGRPVTGLRADGQATLVLIAGRHVITGAKLPDPAHTQICDQLARLSADIRSLPIETGSTAGPSESSATLATSPLPAFLSADVGQAVADLAVVGGEEPQLAVAAGNVVRVFALDGRPVRTLEVEHPIRVLHWWARPGLLLAGCVDEQVVAFTDDGRRAWSFTSEMDPAVYEAAKTYWFKSAPGHQGIHGLYTGVFDEGHERCFVGSACTLEILDSAGSLVKRTPVFWGPGRMFELVAGPAGSRNLLISRWPNGNDRLAIVNSRTMAVTGQSYADVPAGHTYVGGWTAQNRTGLHCVDLDGDGCQEVVTAINGTWNRVTVYSEDGKPLYNAQFGPGPGNAPCSRLRDMSVADLDRDGKAEIVVGLSDGLLVALDNQCRKVWARRLASPPVCVQCLPGPVDQHDPLSLVVGCENGEVIFLDGQAKPVCRGELPGRPTRWQLVQTLAGPLIVRATERGHVRGYLPILEHR